MLKYVIRWRDMLIIMYSSGLKEVRGGGIDVRWKGVGSFKNMRWLCWCRNDRRCWVWRWPGNKRHWIWTYWSRNAKEFHLVNFGTLNGSLKGIWKGPIGICFYNRFNLTTKPIWLVKSVTSIADKFYTDCNYECILIYTWIFESALLGISIYCGWSNS